MRRIRQIALEVIRIQIQDLRPERMPVPAVPREVVPEPSAVRVEVLLVDGDRGIRRAGMLGLAEDVVEQGDADVGGVDAEGGGQFEGFEDLALGGAAGEGGAGVGADAGEVEVGAGRGDGEEDQLVQFGGEVAVRGDGAGPGEVGFEEGRVMGVD